LLNNVPPDFSVVLQPNVGLPDQNAAEGVKLIDAVSKLLDIGFFPDDVSLKGGDLVLAAY